MCNIPVSPDGAYHQLLKQCLPLNACLKPHAGVAATSSNVPAHAFIAPTCGFSWWTSVSADYPKDRGRKTHHDKVTDVALSIPILIRVDNAYLNAFVYFQ